MKASYVSTCMLALCVFQALASSADAYFNVLGQAGLMRAERKEADSEVVHAELKREAPPTNDGGRAGEPSSPHNVLKYDDAMKRANALKGKPLCQTNNLTPESKVDIVYLWVNESSCSWWEVSNKHGQTPPWQKSCPQRDPRAFTELKYSLRSLYQSGMMVHINRIFIVISDHHDPPTFLGDNGIVTIIRHSQIFEPHEIPSFNSFAIYSRIHKIPGLGEWYVYMDDDYFWGREAQLRNLYDFEAKKPRFHTATWVVEPNPDNALSDDWSGSIVYNSILLHVLFGARKRHAELHLPFLYKKCAVQEMEKVWSSEWTATAWHKSRFHTDVNLPFLYQNYLIDTQRAIDKNIDGYNNFFMELHYGSSDVPNTTALATWIKSAKTVWPFYLNVQNYDTEQGAFDMVQIFYEEMFPKPSPLEKAVTAPPRSAQSMQHRDAMSEKATQQQHPPQPTR